MLASISITSYLRYKWASFHSYCALVPFVFHCLDTVETSRTLNVVPQDKSSSRKVCCVPSLNTAWTPRLLRDASSVDLRHRFGVNWTTYAPLHLAGVLKFELILCALILKMIEPLTFDGTDLSMYYSHAQVISFRSTLSEDVLLCPSLPCLQSNTTSPVRKVTTASSPTAK